MKDRTHMTARRYLITDLREVLDIRAERGDAAAEREYGVRMLAHLVVAVSMAASIEDAKAREEAIRALREEFEAALSRALAYVETGFPPADA